MNLCYLIRSKNLQNIVSREWERVLTEAQLMGRADLSTLPPSLPDHLQTRVKYPQSDPSLNIHKFSSKSETGTKDKSFQHSLQVVLPSLIKVVESAVKVYKPPRLKLYKGKIHRLTQGAIVGGYNGKIQQLT